MEDTGRDDEETGDPARAFEDLRAEISVLRRAVEALPVALEDNRPPDYSPDLGRIVQGLNHVGATLGAIEKHPALRLTPEQHQVAIARAGDGLLREAAQKLEHAAQEAQCARQQLGGMIGTIREQNAQWNWVFYTGLAALMAGLLLSPLFAGALPFGLDGRVAALIMKDSRWGAGWDLLRAADPGDAGDAAVGYNLVQTNRAALAICQQAAAREGKEQRCQVVVKVPSRG